MAQSTDLAVLTDLWWRCVTDVTTLLEELDDAEWDLPALPGWDVRAVASHIAHLESLLAGGPSESADVPEADHIRTPMAQYTEIGVINRRERSGAEITAEIRAVTERRRAALAAEPPSDLDAPAPSPFGDVMGWTTLRLFQNRPVDLWTHEFDIRRATGRPGHTDAPGAVHTTEQLLGSVPFVLGKKVGAPAGTTVVVEVTGHQPVAAAIGDDGRGHLLPTPPAGPTVRVQTDREAFLIVAGGRGQVPEDRFELTGDPTLGGQFLAQLGVMP